MSRCVLVTGARKGLGRSMSEHLLGAGYTVVGCGRGDCDWELPGFSYRVADVTVEEQVVSLVRGAARDAGGIYAVVNNAATASMNHSLLMPGSSLEEMLASSALSTFLVSREAAKVMRRAGRGRVVNLSSVAVPLRLEGQSGYVAAKSAVERMTQVLAREWAPFGITVNTIGASPIDTDMTRGVPTEKMQGLLRRLAVGRMGEPRDVTNVLDFFLRAESEAVTGQVVYLGGVPNG